MTPLGRSRLAVPRRWIPPAHRPFAGAIGLLSSPCRSSDRERRADDELDVPASAMLSSLR
jgi:hypothetical protein